MQKRKKWLFKQVLFEIRFSSCVLKKRLSKKTEMAYSFQRRASVTCLVARVCGPASSPIQSELNSDILCLKGVLMQKRKKWLFKQVLFEIRFSSCVLKKRLSKKTEMAYSFQRRASVTCLVARVCGPASSPIQSELNSDILGLKGVLMQN